MILCVMMMSSFNCDHLYLLCEMSSNIPLLRCLFSATIHPVNSLIMVSSLRLWRSLIEPSFYSGRPEINAPALDFIRLSEIWLSLMPSGVFGCLWFSRLEETGEVHEPRWCICSRQMSSHAVPLCSKALPMVRLKRAAAASEGVGLQ